MKIKQCELTDSDKRVKVVWLDASKPLKFGSIVTGKDKHVWTIRTVYQTICDLADIHTDWEVGGLS